MTEPTSHSSTPRLSGQADLIAAVAEGDRLIGEQAHDDRFGHRVERYGIASLDAPLRHDADATFGDLPSVSIFEAEVTRAPRHTKQRALDVDVGEYEDALRIRRDHLAGPYRPPKPRPFRGRLAEPTGSMGRPRMLLCSQGHAMTDENTRTRRIRNRPYPVRECWTCIREKRRAKNATPEYRAKHAAYERERRARRRAA